MAKEKKVEAVEPVETVELYAEPIDKSKAAAEDFVARKLKAINSMEKPMKAQRLANRLLRKARNN